MSGHSSITSRVDDNSSQGRIEPRAWGGCTRCPQRVPIGYASPGNDARKSRLAGMKKSNGRPVVLVLVSALVLAMAVAVAKADPIAQWLGPRALLYDDAASGHLTIGGRTFSLGYCFGLNCPHNEAGSGAPVPGPLGDLGAAGVWQSNPIELGYPLNFTTDRTGRFEEDVATTVAFEDPTNALEHVVFARQFTLTGGTSNVWNVRLGIGCSEYAIG